MDSRRKGGNPCRCQRRQVHERQKERKECKRKRQTLVYNADEEVSHEIYMQDLRKEFSDVSILCDSKIELPWREIALPAAGMKIRAETALSDVGVDHETEVTPVTLEPIGEAERKESTGTMPLPWQDLIVTDTVESSLPVDAVACDSSLEIPWADLSIDRPMDIRPPPEDAPCPPDAVEIPWDVILVPPNIVIESPKKRIHPSSRHSPRGLADETCPTCGVLPCCAKTRSGKR